MTWHAQLNCQRSTPPDGKSGPLNRGDSNDDRTSSSPNRSVGIYPTGQLLRLRLHLAFVKSFSEFFFAAPPQRGSRAYGARADVARSFDMTIQGITQNVPTLLFTDPQPSGVVLFRGLLSSPTGTISGVGTGLVAPWGL
jgi:hypothetical protein